MQDTRKTKYVNRLKCEDKGKEIINSLLFLDKYLSWYLF